MRENAKKDTETYLEKQSKKSIWTNSYRKLKKIFFFFFACYIRMSKKVLNFDEVEIDKNRFHGSKQLIDLNLVDFCKIITY